MTGVCAYCNAPFETSPHTTHQKYCSHQCAQRQWHLTSALKHQPTADADLTGNEQWRRLSDFDTYVLEVTRLYDHVCLMCSRRQTETPERLTRERAKQKALVGLPRCTTCHGNVHLEEVEVNSIGSPRYGRNDNYARLQRAWGMG